MENETIIYDNKKTVLIVDDEQHILDILTFNLKKEGYNILEANDGVKAVEIALEQKPDIVLLDIMLPGMDGLSVCKRIKHSLNIPVLMLTAKDQEIDKILGLELGADDYITKPFSLKELTARVEAHLRREERSKNNLSIMTLADGLIINLSSRKIYFEKIEIPFSKKEFDIIEFLIANSGQVFDKEQIYEKIWGYDALGDSNVVKEHIRKIRAKFKVVTGKEYIDTSWGVGYCWKN